MADYSPWFLPFNLMTEQKKRQIGNLAEELMEVCLNSDVLVIDAIYALNLVADRLKQTLNNRNG